ncbi:IclR family transcriptional regulator [Bordetella sp. 15P40C-2]|uniref:IclR family transcriptional regulator n=1 Tax=Bordetella sp. 15P40C-2 TaxID=2572246 RepID=UPI00132BA069|nr:IclR family transcriptional regulator [Bordetella sp. 15P40C-2]MVW70986.1 helix-turn-helix domain-containing protein [Bordetella sp. 15P40C-2]
MAEALVATEKRVGALSAGLRILRHLSSAPTPLGVTRIARDLGLNSSTCFNLLKTLVQERLVTFDEDTKTYRMGLGLVELAKGSLEQASYVRLLKPHLQELANRHRVTTTLWQRTVNDRVVLVDLAESGSTMRVHMSIGQRLPLYIAALGRCMAAYSNLTPAELRTQLSTLRWEDGPSFEAYMRDVQRVREIGYATDEGHFVKGITTVSSPILDENRTAVMAISAVGVAARFSPSSIRSLGEDLRERCHEASLSISGGKVGLPSWQND